MKLEKQKNNRRLKRKSNKVSDMTDQQLLFGQMMIRRLLLLGTFVMSDGAPPAL